MFNRLLKSFAIAGAFLGVIYVLTKEHKVVPALSMKAVTETISSSSATSPVDNKEESTSDTVKNCEPPVSFHDCVLEVLPDIAEGALPSVVSINTVQIRKTTRNPNQRQKAVAPNHPFGEFFKEFFNFEGGAQAPRRIEAQGSGFVIKVERNGQPHNVVVTNYHVVKEDMEGSTSNITITFHHGAKISMMILAKDPKSDIAVLAPKNLKDQKILNQMPYLTWGDSGSIRPGQKVLALGNPFGLGSTVTDGIISYTKGRDIPSTAESDRYINILPNLIQHSAQINFGSSGGVLLGLFKENNKYTGKIIGINTAMYTPSGGNVGVGFSIPSNMAKEKIDLMMKYGRVLYGWLGVVIEPVDGDKKANFGIKEPSAYLVREVAPNSPAHKAGLKVDDVIVTYNGKVLDTTTRLEQLVNQTKPGSKVTIGIYRNNNFKNIITLPVLIEENKTRETVETQAEQQVSRVNSLGMEVETFKNPDGTEAGVRVLSIDETSLNIDISGGIEPGNVIEIIFIPVKDGSFTARLVRNVADLNTVVKTLQQYKVKNVNCQVKVSEKRSVLKPLVIG